MLEVLPDDYSSNKNLALLYQQQGETDKAISAAQKALAAAPDEDKAVLEAFLEELGVSTAEPTPITRRADPRRRSPTRRKEQHVQVRIPR